MKVSQSRFHIISNRQRLRIITFLVVYAVTLGYVKFAVAYKVETALIELVFLKGAIAPPAIVIFVSSLQLKFHRQALGVLYLPTYYSLYLPLCHFFAWLVFHRQHRILHLNSYYIIMLILFNIKYILHAG